MVEVIGLESTVLIKLEDQFAGHLESTTGLDPDAHIQAILRAEAGWVMVPPWAFCHGSLLSNRKTQSQVRVPLALQETEC